MGERIELLTARIGKPSLSAVESRFLAITDPPLDHDYFSHESGDYPVRRRMPWESSSLLRAAAEVVLPHTYSKSYGKLMLARPLFVDDGEITGFADDLTALFTLLTSLPARCFDEDLKRYCAALGMDERLAELMRSGATGHLELYGRADAYHDGTSFRLLEFNVGSELGGIDVAQVNRAFLHVASFRDFADHHHVAYIDTAAVLADALRTAAHRVASSGEPVVALLRAPVA